MTKSEFIKRIRQKCVTAMRAELSQDDKVNVNSHGTLDGTLDGKCRIVEYSLRCSPFTFVTRLEEDFLAALTLYKTSKIRFRHRLDNTITLCEVVSQDHRLARYWKTSKGWIGLLNQYEEAIHSTRCVIPSSTRSVSVQFPSLTCALRVAVHDWEGNALGSLRSLMEVQVTKANLKSSSFSLDDSLSEIWQKVLQSPHLIRPFVKQEGLPELSHLLMSWKEGEAMSLLTCLLKDFQSLIETHFWRLILNLQGEGIALSILDLPMDWDTLWSHHQEYRSSSLTWKGAQNVVKKFSKYRSSLVLFLLDRDFSLVSDHSLGYFRWVLSLQAPFEFAALLKWFQTCHIQGGMVFHQSVLSLFVKHWVVVRPSPVKVSLLEDSLSQWHVLLQEEKSARNVALLEIQTSLIQAICQELHVQNQFRFIPGTLPIQKWLDTLSKTAQQKRRAFTRSQELQDSVMESDCLF